MKVAPNPNNSVHTSGKSAESQKKQESAKSRKGDEDEDDRNAIKYANTFDLTMLVITIVIGGQVFSWNFSLGAGYWEGFLILMLTSIGFYTLILCMAEMNSTLPFPGGSYGFVRVCMGPFIGYIVGCCEALQNIAYVSAAVLPFGQMLTLALQTPVEYEPIWWTFFYVTAIGINVIGGWTFWKFNIVIGVASLIISIIYIFGTIQYGDFDKYSEGATLSNYTFDGYRFMQLLPVGSWWYIGVESLPLVSNDCPHPQSQLSAGMTIGMTILFFTAIGTFFTSTSQAPGTAGISDVLLPLNPGYTRLFGISESAATWLALPSTYATGFGFMFVYGRQICSMARSGLLPPFLRARFGPNKTPFIALVVGSALSLVGLLSIYYTDVTLVDKLFHICILASYFVYIAVFISYFIFRVRYKALPRKFYSPLGEVGAFMGAVVFAMGMLSVVAFHGSDQIALIIYVIYIAMLLLYYYFYGYRDQKLSDDEQRVLFRAYVINANTMSRNKKKGARSVASYNSANTKKSQSEHNQTHRSIDSSTIVPTNNDREEVEDGKGEDFNQPVHTENNRPFSVFGKLNAVVPSGDTSTKNEKKSDDEDDATHRAALILSHSHKHPENAPSHSEKQETPFKGAGGTGGEIRRSFAGAISEKFKEIVEDLKILPLMNEASRDEYERVMLGDVLGQYPDEVVMHEARMPSAPSSPPDDVGGNV